MLRSIGKWFFNQVLKHGDLCKCPELLSAPIVVNSLLNGTVWKHVCYSQVVWSVSVLGQNLGEAKPRRQHVAVVEIGYCFIHVVLVIFLNFILLLLFSIVCIVVVLMAE